MKTQLSQAPAELLFDGACPFCSKLAACLAPFLKHLNISVIPLQTAGPQHTPSDLLARIHLIILDGRIFTGADALIEVARRSFWTRPLTLIADVPGVMRLLRLGYDWVARNRRCLSGKCLLSNKGRDASPARTKRVFFEMP